MDEVIREAAAKQMFAFLSPQSCFSALTTNVDALISNSAVWMQVVRHTQCLSPGLHIIKKRLGSVWFRWSIHTNFTVLRPCHRIIEYIGLEGTSRIIDFQPPCHSQGCQLLDQAEDQAVQGPSGLALNTSRIRASAVSLGSLCQHWTHYQWKTSPCKRHCQCWLLSLLTNLI